MFVKNDCNNTAAWQINSQKKLLINKDKYFKKILRIILAMGNIYIKYLNQANHANK